MKQTSSQKQMPTYEVSGKEFTIFWDEQELTNSENETVYLYNYCVASIYDERSKIIEKIMACYYPSFGSEVAAIVNGGEDAANHASARTTAKGLADGWISSNNT